MRSVWHQLSRLPRKIVACCAFYNNPRKNPRPMPADQNNLVWIDMEMTGLDPERDRIIEIALVVTDPLLGVVAEAPVLVVHQSDVVLSAMDDWNKSTHSRSGLVDKVRASVMDEAQAEARMLAFLEALVPSKASPMCG